MEGPNMKIGADPRDWVKDRDEVLAFADYLVASDVIWTASQANYYHRKPWKWTGEYLAWVAQGRPE